MKHTNKEVMLVITAIDPDTGIREVIKQEHIQNVTYLKFDEQIDNERVDPLEDLDVVEHEFSARHITLALTTKTPPESDS